MPELNDRQTDELFQVGAERHGFEYNDAAWNQMEALLEADASLTRWKWAAGIAGSVLALAVAAWLLLPASNTANIVASDTFTEVSIPTPGSSAAPTTTAKLNEATSTQLNASSLPNQDQRSTQASVATTSDRQAAENTASLSSPASTNELTGSFQDNLGAAAGAGQLDGDTPLQNGDITNKADLDSEGIANSGIGGVTTGTSNTVANTPTSANDGSSSALALIPPAELLGVQISDGSPALDREVTPVQSAQADFTAAPGAGYLSATVGGGIILGQAGSDPFKEARPRFGASLEYHVSNKFSLGVGAFYNKVSYLTEEKNFSTKDEFWDLNDGLRPNEIRGECQILEIPVSVNYYLNGAANNSLYFSAGASTYLLLKEEYNVFYDPGFDPIKSNWDVNGENQHYLGMGHFSMGYQLRLKGRSALRVETYVQTPFTGIGEGSVKLLTAGVSAAYQFDFKKR
ncbi:outer membrane beta-barrel protein [Lewinella sp. 4G2]|uniref:outer membrane beta-barrel protein n=1 Tax=Lewinella sp. 4G2 TaxID=1803372 RepID=UPI0007B4634B|nr:outer membrane beta-barrel protein [Lewinella sp. 4G2]OAV44546.1 hypothetical protein A3850_008600 [Lewinella sp. 4G2]